LDSQPDPPAKSTSSSSSRAPASSSRAQLAVKPYFDASVSAMVRLLPNGQREIATMARGPGNFAVARFGQGDFVETFDTEVPNILLEARPTKVMKKPAAAARKKPAANSRLLAEVDASDDSVDLETEAVGEEAEEEIENLEDVPTLDYPEPPADIQGDPLQEPPVDPAGVRKLYGLPPREKPKPVEYVGGKLRIVIVEKKSYITVQAEGSVKPTMLIGCEKNMALAHDKDMEQIILGLWDAIISEGIVTKEAAANKKQQLLSA